ncbi:MAG: family 20 glycosylhydrolase [Bacteroidota bacterium]
MRNLLRILCFSVLFTSPLWMGCRTGWAGPDLEVVWRLEENVTREDKTSHTAVFYIVNRGRFALKGNSWNMYWNQAPRLVTASEGPARVQNINGDFYRMVPSDDMSLAPGDTAVIRYVSEDFAIKVSDGPLGLYITYTDGGEEKTKAITRYKVLPFESEGQYTRNPRDEEPFPDPAFLFRQNERLSQLPENELFPFIPAPASWTYGNGHFDLGNRQGIQISTETSTTGQYLCDELARQFGLNVRISDNAAIRLKIVPSTDAPEGYQLSVSPDSIVITGNDEKGVFYGVQSLLSLVKKDAGGRYVVPAISVTDKPAFAYRGLHLDVCRNFQSKETVLRLLDMMARYKLNKLLFNLTEDEGWRLEINGLPELTEVGGRRGHLYRDSLYLAPAYGSGPDPCSPRSHGNGYYSRSDFKQILRYAQQRNIEVIPEINLPGHSRAAIKAMELRYQRLMAKGQPEEANRFRLIDPADTSQYRSAQGYNDNTTCVCRDQVIRFFEYVLDDVISMYKEAGVPLNMFHTGGDEVPSKAWTGSPECRDFMARHPEIRNNRNLQGLFFGQMIDALKKRGLLNGTWEEAVMSFNDDGSWTPNPAFANSGVYPYIWNNLWGNQDLGYRLANAGYPVVLCNVTNFYFDLAYNKDPREPGLYWGGFIDTEDAFSFVPYDLFQSTKTDDMGRPFDPAKDFAGMERLTPAGKQNIAGLQAQLWSETIKGRDMLEYYYLPKLPGFAQRAWQGEPAWSGQDEAARLADWNRFSHTLALKELPRLTTISGGYNYRIPPPGIMAENGQISMNTAYTGFQIRYTTDGTEPDNSSTVYSAPFSADVRVVKAACFNEKGRSGFSSTLHLSKK